MMNVTQNILVHLLVQFTIGHIFAQSSNSPVDITGQLGLHYPMRVADSSAQYLHRQFPGTPICFDFDADNDLDIFLPYGYAPANSAMPAINRLYANTDTGWTDISTAVGLDAFGPAGNAAVGDINGDGYPDLYFCNLGEDRLLMNVAGQYFTDISTAIPSGDDSWSSSAVFFDANLDGKLDLYVANYLIYSASDTTRCLPTAPGEIPDCDPQLFDAAENRFYYGDGLGGFTEATNLLNWREKTSRSLKAILIDANGDSALDLLVLSYRAPNLLYLSDRSGGMNEVALSSGLAVAADGSEPVWTDVEAVDINNDGYEDVLFIEDSGQLHLLLNDGIGHFFPGNYQAGFFNPDGPQRVNQLLSIDYNLNGFDDLIFITLHEIVGQGEANNDSAASGVIWERTDDGSRFVQGGSWQPIRLDTNIIVWGGADSTLDTLELVVSDPVDTAIAYGVDDFHRTDSIAATEEGVAPFPGHLEAAEALPLVPDTLSISGWPTRMMSADLDGDGQAELIVSYGYGAYHVWQWTKETGQNHVGFYFATNGNGTSPIGGLLEIVSLGRVRRVLVKGESSRVIFLKRRDREIDVTFTWLDGVTATYRIDLLNNNYRLWTQGEE